MSPAIAPPARVRPGSIGIMGGTFDPIHLGHLAIAEEAREALGLARILFIPAAVPPHRPAGSVSPAEERAAMVGLAIEGNPAFELSRIEMDRPGPSFTSETVDALAATERAAGREPDLTFILSAETLRQLPTWHEPERLLDACRLAMVPRDGHPAPTRAWLRARFPGRDGRIDLLSGPRLAVSSTVIRERLAAGRSIRYLVPPAVERYIGDHGLYRAPGAAQPIARPRPRPRPAAQRPAPRRTSTR
ncbi:MAG TPA: nicotinate-nucleotide adenylyltransferase [Candidatus Limnocylindrales bacterium]|nr:nicotinate-nucleotide adenylyltransferase [Candidatus Limnocylindrales bacterium]